MSLIEIDNRHVQLKSQGIPKWQMASLNLNEHHPTRIASSNHVAILLMSGSCQLAVYFIYFFDFF
jgi:hypothetical protein